MPVRLRPPIEGSEWFGERLSELCELIERRGLDTAGVNMASQNAIALSSTKGVGQDFVRYPVEGFVEFLVTTAARGKLR
jgi:hypothetical protein